MQVFLDSDEICIRMEQNESTDETPGMSERFLCRKVSQVLSRSHLVLNVFLIHENPFWAARTPPRYVSNCQPPSVAPLP